MQKICFRSPLKVTIVATLFAILNACGGGGGDSVEDPAAPSSAGILLEGDVNVMASEAMRDYDAGDRTTPDEISVDSDGIEIDRTNISIAFVDTASVGEMNAFLDSFNAKIVSMIEGVNIVLVKIPDPQDLATLDTLIQQIENNPLIRRAIKADMGGEDSLPGNYDAQISDLTTIGHQLAVLAPAAWNGKAALLHSGASAPLFLQADSFGNGIPNDTADIKVLSPGDFASVNTPSEHGYHVLGIVSGRHSEFSSVGLSGDLVTGIYPGTIDVRIVDTKVLNTPMRENKLVSIIKSAGKKVVVNTSKHGGCVRSLSGETEKPCIERKTRDWLEKVRGSILYNLGLKNPLVESSYLHLTSAGNFRSLPTEDNKLAALNSQYSAAKLLSGLTTDFGLPVTNTSNTLVVENRVNTEFPNYQPDCLAASSKKSGDISAIGNSVWSLIDTSFGAGYKSGTSMSTPQVAGLAAYVWALNPQLSPEGVMGILKKTSKVFAEDESCVDVPAPVIDAYAAVLAAIDTPDDANSAPVRFAILDIADSDRLLEPDGVFDENDIARYIAEFDNRDGQERDLSRFDLNGDGYTGGTRKALFNLDMDSEQSYTNVVQSLPEAVTGAVATNLSFDESNLTDLDILCYYGFSSLFTGDTVERDADLIDECVPNKVLFTQADVPNYEWINIMSMNPDGSDQTLLTSRTQNVWDLYPVLSPDGNKIVFLRNTNIINFFNRDVFIMDVDGSNLTNLTNNPDVNYGALSWSPDGTKILFQSMNQRLGEGDILTMNVDGSNLRNLTNSITSDRLPSWSPDGTTIVFRRTIGGGGDGRDALYSMNPNGTQQEAIVSGLSVLLEIEWSPDSTQIIFKDSSNPYQIIDADGSNRRTLLDGASHAKWSPDGTKIVFQMYQDQSGISIMNSDGSNVISLTNSSDLQDITPIWSSDGKRIYFIRYTSNIDGTGAIYSIDPEGFNLQNLTNDPVHDYKFYYLIF